MGRHNGNGSNQQNGGNISHVHPNDTPVRTIRDRNGEVPQWRDHEREAQRRVKERAAESFRRLSGDGRLSCTACDYIGGANDFKNSLGYTTNLCTSCQADVPRFIPDPKNLMPSSARSEKSYLKRQEQRD